MHTPDSNHAESRKANKWSHNLKAALTRWFKVTFWIWSPSWRSLSPWKGHLTIGMCCFPPSWSKKCVSFTTWKTWYVDPRNTIASHACWEAPRTSSCDENQLRFRGGVDIVDILTTGGWTTHNRYVGKNGNRDIENKYLENKKGKQNMQCKNE